MKHEARSGGGRNILYFSDCYIFGGCENILASLLASPVLRERYRPVFSYRAHEEYERGVALRVPADVPRRPLFLMSNESFFHRLASSSRSGAARALIRAPFLLAQRLRLYPVFNFLVLWAWFRRASPDLLHINNGGYPGAASCRVAVLSAKLAGVKRIVFVVNNFALPQRNFLDKVLDALVRRGVDRFVTASTQVKARLSEARAVDPGRITQIYNTVRDCAVTTGREALLARHGLPGSCFLIVEVAFLTARKGQIHLLRALDAIKARDPEAFERMRVILVGEGEDRAALEDFVRKRGLDGRVVFAGFQADSSDYVAAADVFALPSTGNEDMPLVILDAMRLGKAVISTDLAGIAEEIRNGEDGLLLPPSGLDGLADALLGLYHDPERRRRYGESAMRRFGDTFSYSRFAERYVELYDTLLDGSANRG